MYFLRALSSNAVAIAAMLLLSATDCAWAQGKLSEAKAIPKSCNKPNRLYVQRDKKGLEWFSDQIHERWVMYAQSPTKQRFYLDYVFGKDLPWYAGPQASVFYNRKKSDAGFGWIVADDYVDKCAGKARESDGNQMTLWQCNKGGTYPNFYAVSINKRDYVFFDVDGKTYRLYVEEADQTRAADKRLVRYEECRISAF